jgi:MFS family permease
MLCFALAAAMIGTHGRTELSLTGLAAWSVSVDLAVRYQGSEVLGCCRVTAHRRGAQLRMGRRFYRGWPHLLVAALAMVATMPSRTFGLGLITEQVIADVGITRVSYATINLWSTLIGALFCLPVGWLLDRVGSRLVLAGVSLGLGLSVLLMTGPVRTWAGLFFAYTLLRGFGQSALSVVSLGLVGKWFGRRLPLAMGLFSILISVGFVVAFMGTGAQVLARGWRVAWSTLGYLVLFGLVPISLLVVRSKPTAEEATVEFDDQRAGDASTTDARDDWTLWEALRTNAFWALSVATAAYAFISSALLLFQQSILQTLGFDAALFQRVQAVSLVAGLATNFLTGWLAERRSLTRLLAAGMLLQGLLLAALPYLKTPGDVYLYGAGMGAAGGVATVIFFAAWGRTFGQRHVGNIQGAAQLMTVLASAAGPLVLAEAYERTGSYFGALIALAPAYAVLALWCWGARTPVRTRSATPLVGSIEAGAHVE